MTLRDYQTTLLNDLRLSFTKYDRIIACAPTGAGKTVIFSAIANMAVSRGTTVLIITESRKIFEQIDNKISINTNISSFVKDIEIAPGKIYVAMAQTLKKRPQMLYYFSSFGKNLLIINDEAHINTATPILNKLNEARLIGFTATPYGPDCHHLPDIYQECIVGPQPEELVNMGFLCPYFHYMRLAADLDNLEKKGGEYTEESQLSVFNNPSVYKTLIDDLNQIKAKKTIIFCASIAHATHIAHILKNARFPCVLYHSENQEQLSHFTDGEVNICVSVGMLTKGFDYPPIDLIILLRATTSLPFYLQMVGRGSRTSPGKDRFSIIDYGGNGIRLGKWDEFYDWGKLWKATKKSKNEVSGSKMCSSCMYLMAISQKQCPECGMVAITAKEKEEEEKQTQLIELTEAYNKYRGRYISTLSPLELAIYARLKGHVKYCLRIARILDKTMNGYLAEFIMRMGYKPGMVEIQRSIADNSNEEFFDLKIH